MNAPMKTKVLVGGTMALDFRPLLEKLYPNSFLVPRTLLIESTKTVKALASFLPKFGK